MRTSASGGTDLCKETATASERRDMVRATGRVYGNRHAEYANMHTHTHTRRPCLFDHLQQLEVGSSDGAKVDIATVWCSAGEAEATTYNKSPTAMRTETGRCPPSWCDLAFAMCCVRLCEASHLTAVVGPGRRVTSPAELQGEA